MALPTDLTNRMVGDLALDDRGRWNILFKPDGLGQQKKWVFDEATHNWLRGEGIRRVEGSGFNMKMYGEEDDTGRPAYDMSVQADANAFSQIFQDMTGRQQSVSASAMQQGQPLDLEALWQDVYPGISMPDMYAVSEFGGLIETEDSERARDKAALDGEKVPLKKYVTDASKYNEVIEALEARVGSLSQYGLDKDAGYQVIKLGDQYDSDIVMSDGKVTKIGKTDTATKPSFTPGLSKVGDDLKGYDVLQQRSGQLDPVKQRVDPGYIIDPKTMQPYFQQPDGSLQAAPIPSVDDQISMHLVEGNMDAAVSKANFRDRPTSLEYFNAAMEWARSPADTFTISAIVRGVLEPTPGPMGELRRVGAPPAWATQAWVGLQNSMGIPVESMTSGPGAEPGSVNEMTVASSSGLVPNNFASPNSAPTTLDGGRTVTSSPTAPITGNTTVQATDNTGAVVGSMTADMANQQGFGYDGQGGENDNSSAFAAVVPPAATTTTTPTVIPEAASTTTPGIDTTTQAGGSRYEGSLNQKIDGIMATGATVKPGGAGFIHSDGREWDSAGNLIGGGDQRGDQTGDLDDREINPFAPVGFHRGEPYNQGSVDRAAALGISIGDFLDGNWGTGGGEETFKNIADTAATTPYGTDPDDMFVESEADRVARIGTGATLPTTTAVDRGNILDPMFGAGQQTSSANRGNINDPMFGTGAQSGTGSADSFSNAMRGTPVDEFGEPIISISAADMARMQPIDYDSEGGFGSESDIGRNWAQNQADRAERQRWADVLSGNTGDRASAFTGPSSYADTVMPDYSSKPLGATERQIAASQPFDYGDEGGSLQRDIELENARAAAVIEEANRIEEERRRQVMAQKNPIPVSYAPEPAYTPPPQPVVYPEDIDDVWSPPPAPAPTVLSTPTPTPVAAPVAPTPMPVPTPSPVVEIDPDDYAGRWYDEGADGMRTRDRLSLVGESGPELALFPNGTEIIPLDRRMQPNQENRLRRRRRGAFADAIDSFQFGGYVGGMGPEVSDLPMDAQTMPAGIREVLSGRPTRAPRSLFRQAGMRAPSAQTISNLLPEEIGVYQEMGRLAGIPDKAFEREFQSMVPMGQGGTRQARFTPRSTGRTRYGSI